MSCVSHAAASVCVSDAGVFVALTSSSITARIDVLFVCFEASVSGHAWCLISEERNLLWILPV